MGKLILPHHLQPQAPSIARLEIELRHKGQHLKDLVIGNFMYEGKRCYGVSFMHGGKKWELTMATTDPGATQALVEEGKRHLLETVIADIEKRFRP